MKNSDSDRLKNHGLNVQGGEDLYRFYLVPDPFCEIKRITNSVLKTWSTLSIYWVNRYLAKRLLKEKSNNLNGSGSFENSIDHD